jgi:hypothetical protein
MARPFQRAVGAEEYGAAIRLGEKGAGTSEALRWGLMLVIFMRLLSALWMLEGLLQWMDVLTSLTSPFDAIRSSVATAIIFFGIFNLVAAVGLWLATPWGGALWLFAAASQIFVALVMRHFFASDVVVVITNLILIGIYFTLTWKAGHSGQSSQRIPAA